MIPKGMALSGITRIDRLMDQQAAAAPPVSPADADREAVGAIQDLLRGHGHAAMPSLAAADYGLFGPKTKLAVQQFRRRNGLPVADQVDAVMLKKLIDLEPHDPVASRPYVCLCLDIGWSGMTKVLLVTAQLEGMGRFGALNLNTDKAGLSYGIIQWAQKPGRLKEILVAFAADDREEFARIFGGGDAAVADRLIAHTRLPKGGVIPATGDTTNPAFDLVSPPWTDRFLQAARKRGWQKVQIDTSMAAFRRSLKKLHAYAPEMNSERKAAFMLDLANQCGDSGARAIYYKSRRPGISAEDHMEAIAAESLNRVEPRFRDAVRHRRRVFLDTGHLADSVLEV